MPVYKFICKSCDLIEQKRVKFGINNIDCICGQKMDMQMPTLNGSVDVLETVDKNTNTQWRVDHKDDLKKRQDEYYWKVEVPRFVDSGTYSIETMVNNGWIIINEKGQIEVQNKPPHKR